MEGHNATSLLSTKQQEASRASIAWALTAIGTNAMLQPSFTGYIHGYSFDGGIWSHRSSPCFCLIDAAADAWIIAQKFRQTSTEPRKGNLARSGTVLMRVAVFVIGVLPQALQLFSMRGIPTTQALAATFMLATLLSMARSIRAESPLDDLVELKAQLERSTLVSLRTVRLCSVFFGGGTHLMMLIYVWNHMVSDLQLVVSEDVYGCVAWFRIIPLVLSVVYALQHTMCKLISGRARIPRFPLLFMWQMVLPELLLVRCSKDCQPRSRVGLTYHAAATTYALSCVVAYTVQFAVKRLLAWRQKNASLQGHVTVLPVIACPINAMPSPPPAGVGTLPYATNTDPRGTPMISSEPQAPAGDAVPVTQIPFADQPRPKVNMDDKGPPAAKGDELSQEPLKPTSRSVPTERSVLKRIMDELLFFLLFFPVRVLGITLFYMGIFNDRGESWFKFTRDVTSCEPRSHWQSVRLHIHNSAISTFLFIERYFVMLLMRLPIEWLRLCFEAFDYYSNSISTLSEDTGMISFVIFNLATMMLYYLAAFDSKGTSSPGWANSLG